MKSDYYETSRLVLVEVVRGSSMSKLLLNVFVTRSFSLILPWFETKSQYTGVIQFADRFLNELNVTDVLTKMHQREF